ncbi:MAG: hypothetical protein GY934_22445 [Gammaproteobacteria bacterium]|nr:hypothetical protein [Gammaproteobacteria bacterium]
MDKSLILRLIKNQHITIDEGLEFLALKQSQEVKSDSGKLTLPKADINLPEPQNKTLLPQAVPRQAIKDRDVAVIGMSGRFPGAANLDEYWHNLRAGICSITEIPPDRWDVARFYDPDPEAPAKSYSKWGGFLTDIDKFDPLFFNISPAEAEVMDPQQRLVLEEAYHALEDAGYGQRSAARRACGLYVGVMGGNEYYSRSLQSKIAQTMMGNASSILAGRVAYAFDLQGPVITVDTACSSSLVAVDMACKSLINGEAELMLAGGVTLYLTEQPYLGMSKAQMLSPEGLCKTFDNQADGFVPGEGVGFVVLKLLSQAIADGDTIYGVIKGSRVNQDGKTNGLTAPNVKSQRDLQLAVYQNNGIDPGEITYVETHGTGTKLGDPIEVEALSESFQVYTDARQYCALGSVKTNIGHTSAAAGVAGLIKVLLSLKNRQIPASLHYQQENEHIGFKDTPFYVNTELKPWQPVAGRPRLAAVSSFGFSGTNAHVVLEEYQGVGNEELRIKNEELGAGPQVIVLSAKNEERLREYVVKLLAYLEQTSSPPLAEQSPGEGERILTIEQTLREIVSEIVGVVPADIEIEPTFEGYGLDPVQLSRLKTMTEEHYQCELPHTLFSTQASVGRVAQYIASLEAEDGRENQAASQAALSLVSIAYTLQVGREAMEERLALVVSSVEELVGRLRQYEQAGQYDQTQTFIERVYRGNIKTSVLNSELLLGNKAGEAFIKAAMNDRELDQLAQLWVSGVEITWALLSGHPRPRRISLPTYPFTRKRYWVDGRSKTYPTSSVILSTTDIQKVVLADLNAQSMKKEEEQASPVSLVLYDPLEEVGKLATGPAMRQEKEPTVAVVDTAAKNSFQERLAIEQQLRQQLVELLYVDPDDVEAHKKFIDLGLDSITGVEWVKQINDKFGLNIMATNLYDYPTLYSLTGYLAEKLPQDRTETARPEQTPSLLKQPSTQRNQEAERFSTDYGLLVSTGQTVAETHLQTWQV